MELVFRTVGPDTEPIAHIIPPVVGYHSKSRHGAWTPNQGRPALRLPSKIKFTCGILRVQHILAFQIRTFKASDIHCDDTIIGLYLVSCLSPYDYFVNLMLLLGSYYLKLFSQLFQSANRFPRKSCLMFTCYHYPVSLRALVPIATF